MQSSQNQLQEVDTESVDIPGTELHVGRVALGTWAMGGWMWGGTDDRESVATIRAALDQGINLIDTDALSKELARAHAKDGQRFVAPRRCSAVPRRLPRLSSSS